MRVNILWTPKQFEFSNMFSYGEDNLLYDLIAQGIMGIPAPMQVVNHLWDFVFFVSMINISNDI